MPSPSTSTLRMPSASRSSLSHSTKVRSSIAPLPIGTTSSSRLRVMTKPPTCWERWRGKDWISATSARIFCMRGAVQIDAGALELGCAHRAAAHSPDRGGKRADRVLRQPENLADLADGGAAAIGDDGAGDAGMVAAVMLVDVLDHLLAPLVLEIDVDVGRLVAIRRDEALEQEAALARIDIGDAQAVADRRVRRRAAALAEDVLAAREADDVVDGEKVGRIVRARRSAPAHARGCGGHCRECRRDSARRRPPMPDGRAHPAASRNPHASHRDIRSAARRARRSAPRRALSVSSIASGASRNRRAISAGGLR